MNNKAGKSVGAIIKNEKGEYLVQYRLKEPRGLAMPAGHVDEGESVLEALRREVYEETGLEVLSAKEVYRGSFPSPRGVCHDAHEWWAYEVEVSGTPSLKEPTKHKFLCFMSPEKIQSYIEKKDYDPSWFEYILPTLGII